MTAFLLDVNILLALAWPNHVHFHAAQEWFDSNEPQGWATCTITQLGFIRLSSQSRLFDPALTPTNARALLQSNIASPHHHYWSDITGGVAHKVVDSIFEKVSGHAMVTDAYLIALAIAHGGKLATFDAQLGRHFPKDVVLLTGQPG